ncbi:MAG: TRAP transporter substrate-binding protein [Spirochaetes bacterium]|nr:TRAP transporter substrate-binding protein [Spirochaetota bacterium]
MLILPLIYISSIGRREEKKIILKAADDHELTYPTTQGLLKMAELLKKWSHGRITMIVYPSAQLGSERETIKKTRDGKIDINRVNINPITQIVPQFKAFALPYIFRSAEHMHKVVDGEIGKELMEYLKKKGFIGLGFYDSGQRSFYNSVRPIRSIADLKGLRIRVQKAEITIDMVKALGAIPIPMSFEEVYTALRTGVIQGAENNYPSWITKGHFETAKYYTQDEHSRVPEIILFSKKRWDTLSAEDRELIERAAKESIPYQRKLWEKMVEKSKDKALATGCEIITGIDKRPFIKAMEPVYRKHASKLKGIVKRIQAVR